MMVNVDDDDDDVFVGSSNEGKQSSRSFSQHGKKIFIAQSKNSEKKCPILDPEFWSWVLRCGLNSRRLWTMMLHALIYPYPSSVSFTKRLLRDDDGKIDCESGMVTRRKIQGRNSNQKIMRTESKHNAIHAER